MGTKNVIELGPLKLNRHLKPSGYCYDLYGGGYTHVLSKLQGVPTTGCSFLVWIPTLMTVPVLFQILLLGGLGETLHT